MEGIILSAGRGSRLSTVTDTIPKPLIRVNGKPLLSWQIESLVNAGVEKIFIVVGYRAEQIKKFLKQQNYPIEIICIMNEIWQISNNMYSLSLAAINVRNDAIVINGDLCFSLDTIERFNGLDTATVGTLQNQFSSDAMKIRLEENEVKGISKEFNSQEAPSISADIYYFPNSALVILISQMQEHFQTFGKADWFEKAISNCLSQGLFRMNSLELIDIDWIEIDNPIDLNAADALYFNQQEFMDYDNYYFDIDGTILLNDEPINGVIKILKALEISGKNLYAVSNNTSRTVSEIANLFDELKIPIAEKHIVTPLSMLKNYLRENEYHSPIFLMETNIKSDLNQVGFESKTEIVDLIVIGNDLNVTSEKLAKVLTLVGTGVPYLLTHSDKLRPTPHGVFPDAGSWGQLIEGITGIPPLAVLGKPSVDIFGVLPLENSILIGDRIDTDIQLGINADMGTALVLTGITSRADYENTSTFVNYLIPDYTSIGHKF